MCYVEKTGWQEKYILPVQLGALAYGELERGLKKNSTDDIVEFLAHFSVSRATGATSAPKTFKKKWGVRQRCCTSGF